MPECAAKIPEWGTKMPFDDGDKAFIKLAVRDGFDAHREQDHKPLEEKINKINIRIASWGGGIAAIVALFEFLRGK